MDFSGFSLDLRHRSGEASCLGASVAAQLKHPLIRRISRAEYLECGENAAEKRGCRSASGRQGRIAGAAFLWSRSSMAGPVTGPSTRPELVHMRAARPVGW